MLSSGTAYVFIVGLTSIVSLWLFDFYGAETRSASSADSTLSKTESPRGLS